MSHAISPTLVIFLKCVRSSFDGLLAGSRYVVKIGEKEIEDTERDK